MKFESKFKQINSLKKILSAKCQPFCQGPICYAHERGTMRHKNCFYTGSYFYSLPIQYIRPFPLPDPLPAIENDPSSFAEDWLAAFKAQEHTDVIFVLGSGTETQAHKIVLCAASSFFANIINSASRSEVSRIPVKLPWIFPAAPLKINGAPGNIQGNLTAMQSVFVSTRPYWSKLLFPCWYLF